MDAKDTARKPTWLDFGDKKKIANDTPEAREARIQKMMEMNDEKGKRKLGKTGKPLNLFTREEYNDDEIHGDGLSD